jgi:tetratricopeptide (TPR) repeat protein
MKRVSVTSSLILLAALTVLSGCRSASADLGSAETQRRFGVRMAKMNLWREAMFRFRRATEIEPQNAMARNNLAVAYEATGNFDAALREYREALKLDRSNEHIQKNYSRFVEFTQRSKKREAGVVRPGQPAAAASAPTGTAATAPPVVPASPGLAAPAPTPPTAAQPAVTPPAQQPQPDPPPPPPTDSATEAAR